MALEHMCRDFARKLGITLSKPSWGILEGEKAPYHIIRSINTHTLSEGLTVQKKYPIHQFSISYVADYPGKFVQTGLFIEIAHGCIDDYILQLEHSDSRFCKRIVAQKMKKRKKKYGKWHNNSPSYMYYASFPNISPRLFRTFMETMIPDLQKDS